MYCLDDNILSALLEGTLPADRAALAHQHIDGCEACRQLLSRIAATLELDSQTGVDDDELTVPRGPMASQDGPEGSALIAVGTSVDHYEVEGVIGIGGMGQVYLARDTQLGRKVALKFIHTALLDTSRAHSRFLFEARATASFSHPNIVAIYGVGEHEGRPYVALEYVAGRTLRTRLQQGSLDPHEALTIGRAMAEALSEAHGRGILHRDLKPANVMLAPDGRVRVLDFGLSKAMGPQDPHATEAMASDERDSALSPLSSFTTVGLLGTPLYMSPEQFGGGPATAASDIWALGTVLYEMICGARPHAGDTLPELLSNVLDGAPIAEIALKEHVPTAVAQLVVSCLDRDPARRPVAREVAAQLRQLQQQAPVGRRWTAQRWAMAGIVAVAVSAVAVWLSGMMVQQRPPTATSLARTQQLDGAADALGPPKAVDAATRPAQDEQARPAPLVKRPARHPVRKQRSRRQRRRRPPRPTTVRHAEPGALVVLSHRRGEIVWAKVYLDGQYRGQTPLKLRQLPAGRHRVEVRRAGYAPSTRVVSLRPGETMRVPFELRLE